MQIARRLTLITLLVGCPASASAQGSWSVFVGGGAAGFGGGSTVLVEVPGEPTQYKPSPTTRLHLGLARDLGRGGVALALSYAKAGLGGYGGNINFILAPALTLFDARLLGSYELITFGQGSLRFAMGPMLQAWSGNAVNSTQTRLGGAAALAVAIPMSRRFGLVVSGSLGVASSPFDQETLDDTGLQAATTWTRELALGLRYIW